MSEPTNEQIEAARSARSSNGYLLLGFALTFLPAPYNVISLLPLLLSVWGTARTTLALRRLNAPRALQVSNGIALGLTVALIATIALPLALRSNSAYNECIAGANTNVARQACDNQFHKSENGIWTTLFGS